MAGAKPTVSDEMPRFYPGLGAYRGIFGIWEGVCSIGPERRAATNTDTPKFARPLFHHIC